MVVAGHRAGPGLKVQRILWLQEGGHALPAPRAPPTRLSPDMRIKALTLTHGPVL